VSLHKRLLRWTAVKYHLVVGIYLGGAAVLVSSDRWNSRVLTRGCPFGFSRGPVTTRQAVSDTGQNRLGIFRQDRRLALPDDGGWTGWGGIPTRQHRGAEYVSRIRRGGNSIQIILYPAFGESFRLSISGGKWTEYDMDTRLRHGLWIITSIMCGYVWLYFIHLTPWSPPGTPAGPIAASANGGTYSHVAAAGGACGEERGAAAATAAVAARQRRARPTGGAVTPPRSAPAHGGRRGWHGARARGWDRPPRDEAHLTAPLYGVRVLRWAASTEAGAQARSPAGHCRRLESQKSLRAVAGRNSGRWRPPPLPRPPWSGAGGLAPSGPCDPCGRTVLLSHVTSFAFSDIVNTNTPSDPWGHECRLPALKRRASHFIEVFQARTCNTLAFRAVARSATHRHRARRPDPRPRARTGARSATLAWRGRRGARKGVPLPPPELRRPAGVMLRLRAGPSPRRAAHRRAADTAHGRADGIHYSATGRF